MVVKRLDLTPHKSPSRGITILDNERQGNMTEQAQAYKAKAGQFLSKGFGLTSYGNRKGTMSGDISEALESKAGLNPATFIKATADKYGKPVAAVEHKVKAHFGWLPKNRGIEVIADGDVYRGRKLAEKVA